MAVAVHPSLAPRSKTYRQAKRVREPIPRGERLPLHHQQDLQDIARGVEETCAGIATKYLSGGDEGDHEDVKLEDVEKMCDRFNVLGGSPIGGWLSRIKRSRRALRAMREVGYHREVATLHVAYGPEDPSTRAWSRTVREYLGAELLGLVRYTDTTEERRKKLVRAELLASGIVHKPRSPGLTTLVQIVELSRVREREAYFDRIITSGDALADAMAPFDEEKPGRSNDETRESYALRLRPYDERAAAHLSRRAEFMLAAKVDAETMLIAASRLYHRAWLVSAQ